MESKKSNTVDSACGHGCACSQSNTESGAMKRRDFVTYGAAAIAMAALAACGVGGDVTSPGNVSATSLNLSDFPALSTVGGVATTTIGRTPIAIVRTGTSTFAAFSRICPHQGGTVSPTSSGFFCPNHGATFNKSGVWVGGQRTSNLTSYPVTFDSTASTLTVGS